MATMAYAPEHEPHKRKRDLEDTGSHPAHHRQPSIYEPGRMQASPSLASSMLSFLLFVFIVPPY